LDIVNSFEIGNEKFYFYDIGKVLKDNKKLQELPIVLKILLEVNLRKAKDDKEFDFIIDIFENRKNEKIKLYPSRVVIKNFKGFKSLVDFAFVKDEIGDKKIDSLPLIDILIDDPLNGKNSQNDELKDQTVNRYKFIKWAQKRVQNLRVLPPESGICHQLNLEYLSTVLHIQNMDEKFFLYPEIVVGTDENSSTLNTLGVLGINVDDIEAYSSIFSFPIYLDFPKVVGVKICGDLPIGITSSDLIALLIGRLKSFNIQNKIVEFYGDGLKYLTLEDRSIIANMANEYNAKTTFFAIDDKTIRYFNKTRGNEDYGKLLKTYLKNQNLFFQNDNLKYDDILIFDLSKLEPSIVLLNKVQKNIPLTSLSNFPIYNKTEELKDGDIVFASISSCNLGSNPYFLIHSAIVAKKAVELGLRIDKKIKAFLSIDSDFVKDYLEQLGLFRYFEEIGFTIVQNNCKIDYTSLSTETKVLIRENGLNVCSLNSEDFGIANKIDNFMKSNYLLSPSLIILYSLIGNMKINLLNEPFAQNIYMDKLWASNDELVSYLENLNFTLYKNIYKNIFKGNSFWQQLDDNFDPLFIEKTSFEREKIEDKTKIENGEILTLFEDNIRTDLIKPSGQIALYSPSAKYLESKGLKSFEYSTFENRNENIQVMKRGIFDNSKVKNLMVSKEGAFTIDYDTNEIVPIYDKSKKFKQLNKPLVIFAGENFGVGQIDYWASKGLELLNVKAIIAKSFDKKYKCTLAAFGILPLEFVDDDIHSLKLKGDEKITIFTENKNQNSIIKAIIYKNDLKIQIDLKLTWDTNIQKEFYKNGGILPTFFNKYKLS